MNSTNSGDTRRNHRSRCLPAVIIRAWICLLASGQVFGQLLPPDAVDLAQVKIVERLRVADLCPVTLGVPDPAVPVFSHAGTEYRFSSASAREQFRQAPEGYVEAAAKARWERNFLRAMSPVWCPVSDQVNPGGFGEFDRLELSWRTCCQFCNPELVPDVFALALERLKERAANAYRLTAGVYAHDGSNPIAGALRAAQDLDGNLVIPKLVTSTFVNGVLTGLPAAPLEDARFDRAFGEWRHYGGDRAHTRFSSLNQINHHTVQQLKVAWRWENVDAEISRANPQLGGGAFKPTPLMVGGVLFTSTPYSQVAAIDAGTGKTLWVHDPKSYLRGRPANTGFQHRGVEYWSDGVQHRIFIATGGRQLVSLDALTGRPDPAFGEQGVVELAHGLGRDFDVTQLGYNSPPVVCRDTVVVGSVVFDYPTHPTTPPGHVRGFDVRTGKLKWMFRTIPAPGETGHETWPEESWQTAGNVNVWSTMSADEELGYVYLPVSTAMNDYYGGHRLGDNLFADSLVCLNAATGERVWHFQTVHHGLWDYDVASGPNLVDLRRADGSLLHAVAQVTKQGFCFVFDRATGRPVWPIEERPVPQTDVAGEVTSPTQPFPTRPPPFERQTIHDEDLVDFTPELQAKARELIREWRHGPMFLPPSVPGTDGKKGSLVLPNVGGGANWAGAAVDPRTGRLLVPSWTRPAGLNLKRTEGAESAFRYNVAYGAQSGPEGLPHIVKPPYYRLTAIDLNEGDLAWQVPVGDGPRHHPAISHLNLGPLGYAGPLAVLKGGGILTGGLFLIGQLYDPPPAGQSNPPGGRLHAFDQQSGREVARLPLDVIPLGTPMTYLHQGRQYLVVSAMNAAGKGELVALALGD